MKEIDLHTPLQFIKGIGKNRSKVLNEEFGLKKCYDILNFFPFRYVDKTKFYKIQDLVDNNHSEKYHSSLYIQIDELNRNGK